MSGCEFDSVSLWYQLPLHASFRYNNNFLTFNFVGATTYQPEQVKYQYMLEGWDESWSGISSRTSAPYGNLPPGNYTFMVKAMNSTGTWSEPLSYSFSIRPPWFWNFWSKLAYLLITITGIFAIFRWRTGELRKRQRELEDTVRERTSEIAKKHREITDSINYAERIQRSLMASRQLLDAHLPEYFVYFNPKERVSGDFFWACNLPDGKFALTCADSTGHGVPGAIMSMLNIAALERAVEGEELAEPNLILDSARKKVIQTLAQDGSEEGGRDGMDAVLVSLDMKERKMVAALANMQLWIMGDGEKRTIAPDKMPVGKHDKQDIPFTRHEIQLKKGDVVYMFSDGYVDQFGGPNGKKFKYRPFEELLFSIHQLPIKEQQVIIRMHFENWKGDLEQVDDVCVIGIRM
jgi:serine phosphatase RsbU (regulator of sigma subunit)